MKNYEKIFKALRIQLATVGMTSEEKKDFMIKAEIEELFTTARSKRQEDLKDKFGSIFGL